MKAIRPVGVAMTLALLVACGRESAPASATQPPADPIAAAERQAWLDRQSGGCRLLAERMRRDAGSGARLCSEGRTNREAIACANDAFRRRQPFTLCSSGWSMDSLVENGVAGLADGNLRIYYFDTMGPQFRGTCLRPNVSVEAGDWPRCRTALAGEIDLRTDKPRAQRAKLPHEEPWPESCAARAARAPAWPLGVQLVSGANPIPDPETWGLSCTEAVPSFEMLIDESGAVACARVISIGPDAPPPGLYDSVRAQLLRWRFTPPTLHGGPLEVRWGMQLNTMRNGEAPLPGPQIYPVCP